MSQQSAWKNIPSSQDNSRTLVNQMTAIILGVLVTVVIGLPLAAYGVGQVLDVIGHLIWFFVASYVVALVVQFWMAQSYKNGLTKKEILFAVLWPLDVIRSIRRGVRAMASQVPGRTVSAPSDDIGPKVLSEKMAFIAGCVLTALAIPLLFIGISTALNVVWSLIWLGMIVWILGTIVQFWVAEAWRDGFTTKELTMAVLWPLGMAAIIREGAKRFRSTPSTS